VKKAFFVFCAALAVLAAPAFAEELTGTLQKIKDSGTITIGYRETSMPFSYIDDSQKPIGFALDICYKIVDEVKATLKLDTLKIELTPVSSADRQRHHRPRMRLDDEQSGAREPGGVHAYLFPHCQPVRCQDVERAQNHRRPQGQDGRLDFGYVQHQGTL
jgi:hypothetical protein